MDLDDIPKMINHLGKDQPFVLTYLMSSGDTILNQNERNLLIFMGVMLWYLIEDDISGIPVISEELIDQFQKQNYKMLEYLADEPESDFVNTVQVIMSKYHQPDLLRYIMDKLTNDLKDRIEFRYQNLGIIVIYLKTIIDCLDSII